MALRVCLPDFPCEPSGRQHQAHRQMEVVACERRMRALLQLAGAGAGTGPTWNLARMSTRKPRVAARWAGRAEAHDGVWLIPRGQQVLLQRPGGQINLDFNSDGHLLGVEVLGAHNLLSEATISSAESLDNRADQSTT